MFFLGKNKVVTLTLLLLLLQILVNLIGALGPELSFDALWYHLTLPKLYLTYKKIFFVPGGLLYYSAFPRLTELFYTIALFFGNEITAKLIHFLFGLGCAWVVFKLLKRFGQKYALLGSLVFYTQLAVGWLSTACYIDLARTFWEILALLQFLTWQESKKPKKLWLSAFFVGLAISTKLLAFYSLFSFLILILFFSPKKKLKNSLEFLFFSFLIPLPWFILSFFYTKNPFFPLFTNWFFKSQANGLTLIEWFKSRNIKSLLLVLIKTVFTKGDILTPIFIISLPLILFFLKKEKLNKIVVFYFLINFFFFFLTPLNYNRFLLPYIPSFIFLILAALKNLKKNEKIIEKIMIGAIFLTAFLSISARALANKKFLPVILGKQTKREFMADYLNFKAGNFYDIDGWFEKNIKSNDRVLVIGIHNLFYLNFPFDHISWAKKETFYDYLLFQGENIPLKLKKLSLIYKNDKMKVKVFLYKKIWQ